MVLHRIREYSDCPEMDAADIASEIIQTGESSGWSGSSEQQAAVQVILSKYNIIYTDDMYGSWEAKNRPVRPSDEEISDIIREHIIWDAGKGESMGPGDILDVPGVWECFKRHYWDEIMEIWKEDH